MLEAYYRVLALAFSGINFEVLGPIPDQTADDEGVLEEFLFGATAGAPRGMIVMGSGFVEGHPGRALLGNLSVSLRHPSYHTFSGNQQVCADLTAAPAISPRADVYGFDNMCYFSYDVLDAETGGQPAALYQPVGDPLEFPYVAAVYRGVAAPNYWMSLVTGWDNWELKSRYCDNTLGRLGFFYTLFSHVFGSIANLAGSGAITLDTPQTSDGRLYTDFMALGNNPVYRGEAVVRFGLASAKKVTARVYDVSGRRVRTLATDRLFQAGEHTLLWDGADDRGRALPRGVYFVAWQTDNGGVVRRKVTFLK
jgi:hypothetical protein